MDSEISLDVCGLEPPEPMVRVLDALSLLPQSSSGQGLHSGDLSAIIYSVLIILFLLFQPSGIVGLLRRGRFEPRLPFRRKGGESASTTNATAS